MTRNRISKLKLPRSKVLRGEKEFSELFSRGVYRSGPFFDIVWLQVDCQGRVAFAASKKARLAVRRNSIKRKLREVYRSEWTTPKVQINIILIGHEKILTCDFHLLSDEFRRQVQILDKKILELKPLSNFH